MKCFKTVTGIILGMGLFLAMASSPAHAQAPTVKTSYATDLTPSSYVAAEANTTFRVNVFVELVEYGSSTPSEVGLVYSTTNSNPEVGGSGVTKLLRNNTALGSGTVSLSGLPIHQDIYVRAFATNASGTAYGEVMTLKYEDWTLMLRSGSTYNFFDARTASGGNGTTAPNLTTFRTDASLFEKHFLASSGGYDDYPTAFLKLRGKSNYPYLYNNGILDVSATVLNAQPGNDYYNVKGFSIEGYRLIRCTRIGGSGLKYLMYVSSWVGNDDDPGSRASDYAHVLCPVASARYWDTKPTIDLTKGADYLCSTTGDGSSSSYSRNAGKYYEFYIIKGHTSNANSGDYTTFVNDNGTPTSGNANFSALSAHAGFTEEWWLCNADGTPYTGSEVTVQGSKVTYVSYFPTETTLQLHLKTTSTKNPDYFYEDPTYKEITFYPQSAPTSITATPSYLTLLVDDSKTISYSYVSDNTPCPYLNITATSNDPSIATVQTSDNGGFAVTGVADGTTTITITALNPDGSEACHFDVEVEVTQEAELADPENGTGIVDNVVFLDDREDHSWSYYSDPDQPIRSLNPADVRIVYFGNGRKNMTNASETGAAPTTFSANAEGVQVNVGEAQDTYYYIKTLERTDGATANSVAEATGRCEYTAIPNPFQVRPTYEYTINAYEKVTSNLSDWTSGTYLLVYGSGSLAFNGTVSSGEGGSTSVTISNNMISDPGSAAVLTLTVAATSGSTTYYYLKNGNSYYGADNNGNLLINTNGSSNNYQWTVSVSNGTLSMVNRGQNNRHLVYSSSYGFYPGRTSNVNANLSLYKYTTGISRVDYRGFYKWRVKKVYGGTIYDAATGGNVIAKGGFIYADQTVWFEPTDKNSMRVELEALWAEAYVNSNTYVSNGADGNANYQCAYERNFKVGTTLSTYTYPVTISTLYPNATSGSPSNVSMNSGYTCSNDVKLENMNITNGGNRTLIANGKNLVVGRGVSGTINRVSGLSAATNSAVKYTIRLESGIFNNFDLISYNGYTLGNTVQTKAVFGSDYDRAKNDNSKLDIAPSGQVYGKSYYGENNLVFSSASNRNNLTFDWLVKSGQIQRNLLGSAVGGDESIYLGAPTKNNNIQYSGKRRITIEGGEMASIAGGVNNTADGYANYGVNDGDPTVMVRMKGGTVRGAIYGGGEFGGSSGDVRMVFTGGTVNGWIAGGCNGTRNTGGELYGLTRIYFGGNANLVPSSSDPRIGGTNSYGKNGAYGGYIYGAGCGIAPSGFDETSNNPNWNLLNYNTVGKVFGSRIVIADKCVVGRDVYGGGNFGFVAGNTGDGGLSGNTDMTTEIYVLGGTIHGDVNGGSNDSNGQTVKIFMRGGELVGRDVENPDFTGNSIDGDIYGGSDTWGTINKTATIEMTGGTVHGNVFGGGYGVLTEMADNTTVTISGGIVKQNVYGGGNEGKSAKDVTVNIMGGQILGDVFGGAIGTKRNIHVKGLKTVNIGVGSDGTVSNKNCYIGGSVYGGSRVADDYALSYTAPIAIPNPYNEDQYQTNFAACTATVLSSRVNIASGYIQYHVFGSGFFGNTYGSTKVYIGKNAIHQAPGHETTLTGPTGYDEPNILDIRGNVYGGADYGAFDGILFGKPTISGYSDIYIDGLDYNTQTMVSTDDNYMNITGSVYGCGTSCRSGLKGSGIYVRNYGFAVSNPDYSDGDDLPPYLSSTRDLQSIQFTDTLVLDAAHIHFPGQGKINSLVTTEKYSLFEITKVARVANGSSLFIDYPIDSLMKLGSYSCADVYASNPSYTKIGYDGLGTTDNKIRVNNGTAIYVHHNKMVPINAPGYGELEGFFHLMNDGENTAYAYARPRQSSDANNQIGDTYNNAADGGFVGYLADKNTYSGGDATSTANAPGHVDENGVQIPYENHAPASKAGEQYFRIWQYRTGLHSVRNGVFDAHSNGTSDTYSVAEVVIDLPPFVSGGKYRIKTDDDYLYIDYGEDVKTVNAGYTVYPGLYTSIPTTENNWMYYGGSPAGFQGGNAINQTNVASGLTSLNEEPDLHFGLVMIPEGGFGTGSPALIHSSANTTLTGMSWTKANDQNPKLRFRLTYSNGLQANAVLEPMTIVFEQYTGEGDEATVVDEVEVKLSVATSTNISQTFKTEVYAVMNGKGTKDDTYTAHVTFPTYVPHTVEYSEWSLKQVVWTPNTSGDHGDASFVAGSWVANSQSNYNGQPAKFAMTCEAALNVDNTLGWERSELRRYDAFDFKSSTPSPNDIGSSLGRHSATIDFTLHYDGSQAVAIDPDPWKTMGVLTFHFTVPNCEAAGSPSYTQDVVVEVEIKRIGRGNNWYLDGVNGSNNYAGNFPNAAMKTLGAIFSRTDYQPGDNIYIVNQVSSGNSALEWNGWNYDGVTLYRYPGGHLLTEADESCIPAATYTQNTGDSPETPVAYKGVLVNVTSNMTMQEIILDGHDQTHDTDAAVEAEAPSVVITEGNTLSLNASTLQHNYNSVGDAGAVMMESNATLNMDYGSDIQHNAVAEDHKGGGVYMNGGSVMNVDNKVIVNNNTEGLTDGTPSNVYQDTYRTWVNVGEHPDPEMKIGVTKTEFYDDVMDRLCAYTPIAHSDYVATANLIQSEHLFYDDRTAFNVLKYDESHLSHPERYDYFLGTWFSAVNTKPDDFEAQEIDTPEELAWAISVVNGRTDQDPGGNVVTPNPNTNFKLTGDIDMSDNLWVPIAKDNDHAYTGTFDGNGHVVTGIRSPLYFDDMGLIGVLGTNGVVENMVAQVEFRDGPMKSIGSIAGTNAGGTIRNCEGGGTLIGTASTENIGGLVGKTTGGTIHSGFATNDITAVGETKVGGLVGENGANLYNSYSNVTISGGHAGGLVGVNKPDCIVENCYTTLTTNAFAYENNGFINYCYMPYAETPSYYGTNNSTVTGHGTYNPVLSVSDYGYMYDDNQVTVPSDNGTNNYVVTDITYAERPVSGAGDPTAMNRIVEWPGMLSALNRWVKVNSTSALTYTPWFRPVAAEINGDLPVLGFPKDISMASTDGRFLDYSASLDGHLTKFNTQKETAHLFLYKNATEVKEVPLDHVHVSINEDAVLKQFVSTDPEKPTGEFINTTVGVSFDNSHKAASDHFGTTLAYDWHFLSTPLADAPLGIDYDEGGVNPWTGEDPQHSGNQVRNVSNSYLPNGSSAEDYAHWDLYCFYEPAYHWINLKRNSDSHYHYNVDENGVHQQITYTNEETFLPGKGYMAAIDKDTYLNSTGTLNGPASDVEVMLTKQSVEPGIDEKGFNLLGNPYQAYLDVNAFLGSSKNSSYLESSYWVYIAEQNNYVAGNAEASSNPALPSAKLHPHQGFFVLAKDEGDNKKVTFEYSMALDNPTQYSYFRDGQVDYPLVNLYVTDTKGMRDLAVMEFNRPEQGGSVKPHGLNNANFELAAQMNGARYSILFTKQGTERVPVSFTTREDGSFTLTWDTYHGNFTSLFLVDNMTGTRTDMLHTDHYTFHSTPDDYAARFYITFKCTEVNDITEGDEFAWYDGNQWNINGTGTLEVIDVLGRILLRRDHASTVSTANLAPGVYMLRLSDGTSAKVQKIVVR